MLNYLLPDVTCHSCGASIEKGELFCKTCGRSRGINSTFQFKKFELIGIVVGMMLFFCLCLFVSVPVVAGLLKPTPPVLVFRTPVIASTIIVMSTIVPTSTAVIIVPRSTDRPVPIFTARAVATNTPNGIDFASYSCPDKPQVKLRVGLGAIVQKYDVNVRSSPEVPQVWDANIVVMLRQGDKMTVIGGPKCAYDGTWWEVKTDSGYTGWVRELQPNKILLKPIN